MHLGKILLTISLICLIAACDNNSSRNNVDAEISVLLSSYPTLTPDTSYIDNNRDPELEKLGMELFFSKSLSGNFDVACVSCHHPLLGGGDKLSLPVGESAYNPNLLGPGRWHDWQNSQDPKANGAPTVSRHSPTIFNSALYNRAMFYDGRVFTLNEEEALSGANQQHRTPDSKFGIADPDAGNDLLASQARFPVTSTHEMTGFSFGHNLTNEEVRNKIASRLRGETGETELAYNTWLEWFQTAFNNPTGTASELITYENIQNALSAYQSSQILINNPWYQYINGKTSAITNEQKQGALLFFTAVDEGGAGCSNCHTPPTFTDELFHNIAIPQFGKGKQLNGEDSGRRGITLQEEDRFKFRTPSLLNTEVTSPYTHTGAFITLEETIKHHINPQSSIASFDFTFSNNPQINHISQYYDFAEQFTNRVLDRLTEEQTKGTSLLHNTNLSDNNIAALVSFLKTLTDSCTTDTECLQQFIPHESIISPDDQRLSATFSNHSSPDSATKALAPAIEPGEDPSSPIAGSSTMSYSLECNNSAATSNTGGFIFEDVTIAAGITSTHHQEYELYNSSSTLQMYSYTGGAAAGDINNDCLHDIYHVTGSTSVDALYINNGNGSFTNKSDTWGINQIELSNGAALADIDGDGDLDIFTTNLVHPSLSSITPSSENQILTTTYKNNGNQTLTTWPEMSIEASTSTSSLSFADIDIDGDIDILSTHWQLLSPQANHLWINNDAQSLNEGNETFNLYTLIDGRDWTWTGIFSDINQDGYSDILIAADFENSLIFQNHNGQTLINDTEQHELTDENAMGASTLDYDNDGDIDWFVTSIYDENSDSASDYNWGATGNRLYQNNNGVFSDVTVEAGVSHGYWGWGSCAADFNNDSWPDIFHVNGWGISDEVLSVLITNEPERETLYTEVANVLKRFSDKPARMFINNADGTFTEMASTLNIDNNKDGRSALCFDYDKDGDIDIFISNHQQAPTLYKNHLRSNSGTNFIGITLKGLNKNTQAIGAKVYISSNNVTQLQEVKAGGTFLGGNPTELHFGLGSDIDIDEIKVIWPRPNYYEYTLNNVSANQFITIQQPTEP